jgi:hypothetical protein
LNWIEAHKTTVDLAKWAVALALGWVLGLFQLVRNWARQPFADIDVRYSSFYAEELPELDDHTDVIRIAIMTDVRVTNPTKHKVGVVSMALSLRRARYWWPWSPMVAAVGFPAPPAFPMGENVKLIPVWFTQFDSEQADLTRDSVEGQSSSAGLALFVVVVNRKYIHPLTEGLSLKIKVTLATGQKCYTKGTVGTHRDIKQLAHIVAGGAGYVRHPSVWKKLV